YIDKYGFWGLMVFVMIPLPVTGAYTGSFAAWIFGVKRRKAFLAVSLGVLIAGVIVTTVVLTGSQTFDFLIKHIG
ncbi:MAG TPA: ligand-binding protein SH3, partial [Chromatiaceae bacterium]|nr:ligand-binding protein SH3 [Chromatiaceae bacterium]